MEKKDMPRRKPKSEEPASPDDSAWQTEDIITETRPSAWQTEDSAWETEPSAWETEDGFDLERVRQGVAKGKRHRSLKQYLGWMIKEGYSKDDALEAILAWNQLNTPPIEQEELRSLFHHYWSMWSPSADERTQSWSHSIGGSAQDE